MRHRTIVFSVCLNLVRGLWRTCVVEAYHTRRCLIMANTRLQTLGRSYCPTIILSGGNVYVLSLLGVTEVWS